MADMTYLVNFSNIILALCNPNTRLFPLLELYVC